MRGWVPPASPTSDWCVKGLGALKCQRGEQLYRRAAITSPPNSFPISKALAYRQRATDYIVHIYRMWTMIRGARQLHRHG